MSESVGDFTVDDILKELEKPGRDPRPPIEEFSFDETIKSIEDVKPGMVIPGIVTNITNFGAFVDIGVKQDGLVHISQLSNTFVSDPGQVVKLNQKVKVKVTEVDVARKRIALSMKEEAQGGKEQVTRQKPQVTRDKLQGAMPARRSPNSKQDEGGNKKESLNAFQAKLAELKKKFDN